MHRVALNVWLCPACGTLKGYPTHVDAAAKRTCEAVRMVTPLIMGERGAPRPAVCNNTLLRTEVAAASSGEVRISAIVPDNWIANEETPI